MAESKACSKCGEEFPLSLFHADKSRSDGRHPWCKKCRAIAGKNHFASSDKAENREKTARWRKNNPEKTLEIGRVSHQKNKEKRNDYCRAYRKSNLEKAREASRAWARDNPVKMKMTNAARRSAKHAATPLWAREEFDLFAVSEAYSLSSLRTKVMGTQWHVDHIVPLRSKKVCGLHCSANLQVIPGAVNHAKGNRAWPDMPQ